jgi:hypothetical protein
VPNCPNKCNSRVNSYLLPPAHYVIGRGMYRIPSTSVDEERDTDTACVEASSITWWQLSCWFGHGYVLFCVSF